MRETEKLLKNYPNIKNMLVGSIIDIGCGDCPVTDDCYKFDINDGDANYITRYVNKQFDVVFSSHCLEHMINPYRTIKEWFNLVKPGGILIVTVPDEDLYEHNMFPSRYNSDHKWTFALNKWSSWCKYSINLADLVKLLDNSKLILLEKQDVGYDYSITDNRDQTLGDAMAQDILIVKKL